MSFGCIFLLKLAFVKAIGDFFLVPYPLNITHSQLHIYLVTSFINTSYSVDIEL